MTRLLFEKIGVKTSGYDVVNLSEYVNGFAEKYGLRNGLIYLFSREEGVVVTFIEYEPSLLSDLEKYINEKGEKLKYIVEAILGKSCIIPVVNGEVFLGVFKHPVLLDLSGVKGLKEVLMIYEGL